MARILRTLALALGFALTAGAVRAEDFDWPGRGMISLDAPASWSIRSKQSATAIYGFSASPKSDVAAKLQISVIDLPPERAMPRSELKPWLLKTVQPHLADSVERKVEPQPLKAAQGEGWFVQITDAKLVGKPPVLGDYKVMRSALLAPDDRALAVITMQFDDAASPAAVEMLAIASSLRFVRSAAPATAPAKRLDEQGNYRFTDPHSHIVLLVPGAGLVESNLRVGGATNNPRYFQLSGSQPNLMVSGWLEPAEKYKGDIKKFWDGETAGFKKAGQLMPQTVAFSKADDWDVITYELALPMPKIRNYHIRAEAVRSGTWVDVHLSTTVPESAESAEACRARLLATLRAFKIVEKE